MNKAETKAKITKLYFRYYDQKVSQTKGGLYTAQLHSGRVPALSHVKLYSSSHTLNNTSVCKIHTWPLTKCPFAHVHPYSTSILSEAAAAVGLWSSEARMVGAVAVLGTDRQHGFIHVNVTPLYILRHVIEKGRVFICERWHFCLTGCFQSLGVIMSTAWLKAFELVSGVEPHVIMTRWGLS